MNNVLSVRELRQTLPGVLKKIDHKLERVTVTNHGKPVAEIMSYEDYESLMETLDILNDRSAMKRIKAGLENVKKGKVRPLEEIEKEIE